MPIQYNSHTRRLGRIDRIADLYLPYSGRDDSKFAADLLTDLQCWCEDRNVRIGARLMRAGWDFTIEPSATPACRVIIA
jgi:hypothetical protein